MRKTNLNRKISEPEDEMIGTGNQPIFAVLTRVVEEVFRLTCAHGAAIVLRDSEGVLCQASTGLAPAVGSRLPPDSGFTRECLETGQVVLCEDAENDPRIRPSVARSLRLRSALAVPILAPGSVLGVMLVISSRPFAFDTVHVAILQRIADSLASISTPETALGEKPVTGARPLLPAPARAPSLAEEQPAAQSSLVLGPPERLINSAPAGVKREPASSLDTLGTFQLPDRKPVATRAWIVAGLVLFLLLLFFLGLSHRSTKILPDNAIAPASDPSRLDATSLLRDRRTVETPNGKNSDRPSSAEGPTYKASSPSSKGERNRTEDEPSGGVGSPRLARPLEQGRSLASSFPNPGDRLATQPDSKTVETVEVEDLVTEVINPASPALVIEGAPIGAQIFIDDRLTPSIDSNGQVEISTVAPGQHHLRLTLNGYRDYEQGVEVRAGQTSTVVAKLEPSELPALIAPAKAPMLAVTPAIPPPVRSIKLSVPDFVLDRTVKAHSGWITAVAFSVDGQRLASGSWERGVKFWNVPTGQELSTAAQMKEIEAIAFSRDGQWLATENSANTVTLWDATTGGEVRTFAGNKPLGVLGSNWVYSIAFSPDGRWLASGVDDKTVRLWDVQTGRAVRDLVALRRSVIYIAFSPDGHWLASGADDKSIGIWDVTTGQQIRRLTGHKRPINAVAFSPNGRWLASASVDKSVRLWDVVTGRQVRSLTGHGNLVTSLAFSPDGLWLASGSWDNTIKIWDVATGHEMQTLAGHNHHIYAVAFDSDGRWLASGSEDGTIELWRWVEGVDQSRSR